MSEWIEHEGFRVRVRGAKPRVVTVYHRCDCGATFAACVTDAEASAPCPECGASACPLPPVEGFMAGQAQSSASGTIGKRKSKDCSCSECTRGRKVYHRTGEGKALPYMPPMENRLPRVVGYYQPGED